MTTEFLKKIFLADAATCMLFFAACVFATAPVAAATGLVPGIVAAAGWICLAAAALLGWLGTRAVPPAPLAWLAVFLNVDWVIASVVVFELEFAALTPLGKVVVLGQAAAVLGIALLEARGVRQLPRQRAAAVSSRRRKGVRPRPRRLFAASAREARRPRTFPS